MSATKKICPLLSMGKFEPAACMEDRCVWFYKEYHQDGDCTAGACALLRIADSLGEARAVPQFSIETKSERRTTHDQAQATPRHKGRKKDTSVLANEQQASDAEKGPRQRYQH